jgi:hypothetical protein
MRVFRAGFVMRLHFAALALLALGSCVSTPALEIESARDDLLVIRVGSFVSMPEVDALAERGCNGARTVLISRDTRAGDDENTFFTYRCFTQPAPLRDLR